MLIEGQEHISNKSLWPVHESTSRVGLTYLGYLFILKWIATCGLKKLKLELSKCLGPNCRHQKSAQRQIAPAKHCTLFPSVEIKVSHNVVFLIPQLLVFLVKNMLGFNEGESQFLTFSQLLIAVRRWGGTAIPACIELPSVGRKYIILIEKKPSLQRLRSHSGVDGKT